MAMRTIKIFDSPGRITLDEAFEAARSLKKAPAEKTAASKTAGPRKLTATKKAAAKKPQ